MSLVLHMGSSWLLILIITVSAACNPYIKEHAVICLKFHLESNPENQKLVSSLEAREVVPGPSGSDALNRMGVDVSVGEDGKVKVTSNAINSHAQAKQPLRRQERDSTSVSSSSKDKVSRKAPSEGDDARQKLEGLELEDDGEGSSDVEFM